MTILKQALLNNLIDTGRLPTGASIDIQSITGDAGSDYRRIELTATRKHCKKPYMYWNICVDIARNLIRWDTTTFYYL
jgi:hypothetical protein